MKEYIWWLTVTLLTVCPLSFYIPSILLDITSGICVFQCFPFVRQDNKTWKIHKEECKEKEILFSHTTLNHSQWLSMHILTSTCTCRYKLSSIIDSPLWTHLKVYRTYSTLKMCILASKNFTNALGQTQGRSRISSWDRCVRRKKFK